MQHSAEEFMTSSIAMSSLELNPCVLRAQLLMLCHEYNKEYTQAKYVTKTIIGR